MPIHVVQPGDSLWKISRTYNVPLETLQTINALEDGRQLVIGETIYVPGDQTYTVQPGDTLWGIAQKLGIPFSELLAANPNLENQVLQVGQTVNLPTGEEPIISTNAYVVPRQELIAEFRVADEALTYISLFSYYITPEGGLQALEDQAYLNAVKQTNVTPLMSITNIAEDAFDIDLATTILTNENLQDTLITNIIEILRSKGYRGVNVDFEYLGAENRERFVAFLRKLANRLDDNYILAAALAPKVSATQEGAWYEGHDYSAIGNVVDFVILMTYEWGWSGGPPMPVSPITQVRRVLDFAVTQIDSTKIMMSMPLYGYDWTLPYEEGGDYAKALSPVQATQLAQRTNSRIEYDNEEETPFFNYYDQQGNQHIVWFDDLRSLRAKLRLITEYGLMGVSFWNLAFPWPAAWNYIADNYQIRKV